MTLIFLIGALNFANGRVGGLIAPGRRPGHRRQRQQHAALRRRRRDARTTSRASSTRSSAASASCSSPTASGRGSSSSSASPCARGSRRSSPSWARRSACSPGSRSAPTASRSTTACGASTPSTPRWRSAACSSSSRGGRASSRSPARCSRRCCSARSRSLFIPWGLPALTLPFCFATLAFVLLKGASTELEPVEVADITTPEEHLARSRAERSSAGCRALRRSGLDWSIDRSGGVAHAEESVPAGQHQEVHRPEARRAQPLAPGHPART